MNLRNIIAYLVLLFYGMTALAGPAAVSPVYLRQPDGTTFQAFIKGDEFVNIKTTASGQAIIQENDGWWCYAIYSEDGTRISSGHKVGMDTPEHILSGSSRIPHNTLYERAMQSRMASYEVIGEPIFKKMKIQDPVMAKANSTSFTKHAIVILAEFKDIKFEYKKDDFIRMLTEEGYSDNGATGSAKEYFDDQFCGMMEFEFHVSDIVTLSRNRSYYGSNDSVGDDQKPAEMVEEACTLADKDVNFSLFDDDGDGFVDNVFVFFAGHDEAEGGDEECIWSHAWDLRSAGAKNPVLDETIINRYACASELTLAYDSFGKVHEFMTGIGTFCHEYSHTLGLPDFYDVDYEESGGIAAGLWYSTSLMDGGNYNNLGNTPPNYNAIERMIAGISEPEEIWKSGTYTLEPVNTGNKSYKFTPEGDTGFYLFECRAESGWDKHIGGSGMLAYHIDMSSSFESWRIYNEVNIDPDRQMVNLLEADGRQDKFSSINGFSLALNSIAGVFFPHGNTAYTGDAPGFSITSVRKGGESIVFTLLGSDDSSTPPTVENITKDVFADAAIIGFESSYIYEGAASVSWGRPGEEKKAMEVKPYSPGKYSFILEGLEHSGKTYEIDIRFLEGTIEGEGRRVSIMTKKMPAVDWPYIYLGNMTRNSDGSFKSGSRFPLKIYGADEVAEINWEFNGRPAVLGGDGYYVINESGTLQATIYREDGSIDKVMKTISISEGE